MKKYIALLLTLVMLLLAACGTAQPPVDEQTPSTEVTEPSGMEAVQGNPTEDTTQPSTDEPTTEPTDPTGDSSGTDGTEETTEPTTSTESTKPSDDPTEETKPEETEPKVSLSLNKTSISLEVDDTYTLKATYSGASGKPTWSSNKTSVATVDSNGKVTAKSAGTATITVKYGGETVTCKVTVTAKPVETEPPVEVKLSLNKTSISLEVGDTYTLKATYSGASGKPTWESSAPSVATVDSNGKVTAKSAGTAIITAKYGGKNAQCVVTINKVEEPTEPAPTNPPVEVSIKLNKRLLDLTVGETYTLKATTTGNASLSWSSSNASVASVDPNGKVTAKSEGTAIITATYGSVNAQCVVEVYAVEETEPEVGSAESVWKSSNNGSWSVGRVGNYLGFSAGGRTADGVNMGVTATSSNTGVATVSVSDNGSSSYVTVSFNSAGTTVIRLTSVDGAAWTEFTIEVKNYSSVSVSSPQDFVNAVNSVVQQNSCSVNAGGSYTVLTLSDAELSWGRAVSVGQSLARKAWSVGGKAAALTYEGVNEEGMHVFYCHAA